LGRCVDDIERETNDVVWRCELDTSTKEGRAAAACRVTRTRWTSASVGVDGGLQAATVQLGKAAVRHRLLEVSVARRSWNGRVRETSRSDRMGKVAAAATWTLRAGRWLVRGPGREGEEADGWAPCIIISGIK
jgi:hypothetical protein